VSGNDTAFGTVCGSSESVRELSIKLLIGSSRFGDEEVDETDSAFLDFGFGRAINLFLTFEKLILSLKRV